MGCFSWMYADTHNTKSLDIGNCACLLNPFGENYFEEDYEGYGVFGGVDVYEIVVDWNKDFIPIMLAYADKGKWECRISETDRENLLAFYNGESISCDKRWLGIIMACCDEDNAKLFYPIKVCHYDKKYDEVPPSESDPNQGFGNDGGWY